MLKFTGKLIVVPWDFSEMSLAALKRCLAMVEGDRNKICVVHVAHNFVGDVSVYALHGVTDKEIQEDAAKTFQQTTAKHPELVGIELTTLFGDPGTILSDYAEEIKADLIVISSHGRTGITRFLIGSVAERVARLAKVPVLVLKGGDRSSTS